MTGAINFHSRPDSQYHPEDLPVANMPGFEHERERRRRQVGQGGVPDPWDTWDTHGIHENSWENHGKTTIAGDF